MQRLPHVLAVLAGLLGATALPAQTGGFTYAAGTHQYRVTRTLKSTQEAMGQTVQSELTLDQLITASLSPKARDTVALTFRVDSISATASGPVPQPDLSKLQGTTVSGAMSPQGAIYALSSTTSDSAEVLDGFRNFFPRLPRDLRPGSSWTDTMSLKANRNGIDITTQTITTSRVLGDTTVDGVKAWRIERTPVSTLSGSGEQQGQMMEMEGKGTGTSLVLVATDGRFLSANGTQQVQMTVNLPAVGMKVPVTQSVTSKVETVK